MSSFNMELPGSLIPCVYLCHILAIYTMKDTYQPFSTLSGIEHLFVISVSDGNIYSQTHCFALSFLDKLQFISI